jgi:hypothetical protein
VRLPIEGDGNKRPFQDTGLDYFGPVRYKSKKGDVKTFHVALFDCLAYRAIHLEIVKDLTAESCLGALRKFFSARGRPQTMLTDNTSYLKAVKRAVTVAGGETDIDWNWTTPLAPWTGGTHERLVALVKHCLRATVDKRHLRMDEWRILIPEVTRVVNSRPLTAMTSEDMVRPLRPLELLEPWEDHPQFELEFADVDEQNDPDYDPEIQMTTARRLAKAYARNTRLLRIFQEVFYQQYFLALRERHEGLKSTQGSRPNKYIEASNRVTILFGALPIAKQPKLLASFSRAFEF